MTTAQSCRALIVTYCLLATSLSTEAAQSARTTYRTEGDCDGFPKVALNSPVGTCVGLVASGLGFARGVVSVGDDIYVADMGGWRSGRGRILRLRNRGRAAPEVILSGLEKPNSLVPIPGGGLYVGLSGSVIRIDPTADSVKDSVSNIVVGLPSSGRHPLAALALASDGSLFVNVGAGTDHCEQASGAAPDRNARCPESEGSPPRGSILRLRPGRDVIAANAAEVYARGLRNAMAMAFLPHGTLVVAANARDFINLVSPSLSNDDFPHDWLTAVSAGDDYGWPYCFDQRRASPEYPAFDCSTKTSPNLLLPPHSAPLGMLIYRGDGIPFLAGKLLIGFHGYHQAAHRIVSITIDAQGSTTGPLKNVVSGWSLVKHLRPQGAPVGLWQQDDGSVLISEDHNGTLLRLSRTR